MKLQAEIFKVLGVESRLKIIELLKRKGPLCVNDIADEIGISASAVSQHLKILKQAGLVNDERQGYFIPYNINVGELENCKKVIVKVCMTDCCAPEPPGEIESDDESERLKALEQYETELRSELDKIREKIDSLKKE